MQTTRTPARARGLLLTPRGVLGLDAPRARRGARAEREPRDEGPRHLGGVPHRGLHVDAILLAVLVLLSGEIAVRRAAAFVRAFYWPCPRSAPVGRVRRAYSFGPPSCSAPQADRTTTSWPSAA